ncbi:multiheme c-type cytochrome [Spirochaetota bacterium]
MTKKWAVYILSIIAIVFAFLLYAKCSKQHFKLSRFIAPKTCGGCHEEIYSQWKNSMHNLAHGDIVYQKVTKFLLKGLTNKDEIKEAESCVKCHIPVGVISGFPMKVSEDKGKIPEIARKGIQCDYCHSATGAKRMSNNDLRLSPGDGEEDPGTKRGPFRDSKSSFHESVYSEFHTSSKICGTCHNVNHVVFNTKLETTYEEWQNGPYNSKDPKKRVVCQGCHMYQRPGIAATGSTARPKNPGKASIGGPDRKHIFTHYFVGGNSFIPLLSNDKVKSKMSINRLRNAAELLVTGKDGKVLITVKNIGAGHKLPTGLTNVRQMWLDIIIKDKRGKVLFSSGQLDKNGYIPGNAIIYNTVFGDGNGKVVSNIAKAKEILKDRRILPQKSLTETVKLPKGKYSTVNVTVKLRYRIAPQKLVDIVTGKGKVKLPIVDMEEISRKISL